MMNGHKRKYSPQQTVQLRDVQTHSDSYHNANAPDSLLEENKILNEGSKMIHFDDTKNDSFSRLDTKKLKHSNSLKDYDEVSKKAKKPRLNETPSFSGSVSDENNTVNNGLTELSSDLAELKRYTKEMKKTEKENGLSAELTLFTDPWKIKKVLLGTDLKIREVRFLFPRNLVRVHVLSFMTQDLVNKVHSKTGLHVEIYDEDTKSRHALILKYRKSSKTCVLINGWRHDFVERRNLKKGDEVGLYWLPNTSKFHFTILQRAS